MSKRNPYKSLQDVLILALFQAKEGKGAERHSIGEPFDQQPICTITRQLGLGFPLGQAMKKITESQKLKAYPARAMAELLGAINYIAAAVVVINERAAVKAKESHGKVS
jgi:hypothetical protein